MNQEQDRSNTDAKKQTDKMRWRILSLRHFENRLALIPLDEAGGAVNQREIAPFDGEWSEQPPDVDLFGEINWNRSKISQMERITHGVETLGGEILI